MTNLFQEKLQSHPYVKSSVILTCLFSKDLTNSDENVTLPAVIPLRTRARTVMLGTNLTELFHDYIQELSERLETLLTHGSQWRLIRIMYTQVEFTKCQPFSMGHDQSLGMYSPAQYLQVLWQY